MDDSTSSASSRRPERVEPPQVDRQDDEARVPLGQGRLDEIARIAGRADTKGDS